MNTLYIIIAILVVIFYLTWMINHLAKLEQLKEQNDIIKDNLQQQTKVLKLISFKLGKTDLDQMEGVDIKSHRDK